MIELAIVIGIVWFILYKTAPVPQKKGRHR